ncbi:MBL fold metallo-hydrolase [Leptospira sp. GIMC2001]|uniref:MBL fold metallo-hydrolase n=1 Tax=Leptospira sp. GIMC2001 TaxID=1513297 RepID=UPI00234BEFFB|nr:MBL fold metallo-hydrolase [Leptospira sp. GIMC2001]WCL49613.1 MBL fold metallo-hydrolase [Leptospira sp. GIMC2001]
MKIISQNTFYLIIIIFIYNFVGCSSTNFPRSDHFDGSTFHNPKPVDPPSFYFVARHILFGRSNDWIFSDLDENKIETLDDNKLGIHSTEHQQLPIDKIAVHWVGHATTLIQLGGKTFLTDPVWSNTVGPLSTFGPTRAQVPGIEFQKLPNIDYVLLSHDHFDHTDIPTLLRLQKKFDPRFIVPLGMAKLLNDNRISNIIELDWWNNIHTRDGLVIHLTPAQHNSGRGLFDRNKRLWGSFVLEYNKFRVFFAGDTAYSNHFSEIYNKLGKIHFAILPIGAYEPAKEMRKFHTSPNDAILAFKDLHSNYMLPIHFATFNLTAEDQKKPLEVLRISIKKFNLSEKRFLIQKIGGSWKGNLSELGN